MTTTTPYLSQGLKAVITVILLCFDHQLIASPLLQLNVAQASEFHKALTALAEQGHVAIVAEGVPLNPHLALSASAKLLRPLTLDDAVTAVGDACDYTVQRRGNVFVLEKRYTDPNDIPPTTQSECEQTLANLKLASEPFNSNALSYHIQFLSPPGPKLSNDQVRVIYPIIDTFAASLTPEQLTAMKQNMLLISSLRPDQKTIARQLCFSLYVQTPIDRVGLLTPKLKQAEQSAIFRKQDANSFQSVFGYTLPKQIDGENYFHTLNHSTGSEDFGTIDMDQKPAGPDSTDPSLLPAQSDSFPRETLADAMAVINDHYSGAIHANVDAAVAAEPTSLVGVGNVPLQQIMEALADVYGLSLTASKLGDSTSFTLALAEVTAHDDLARLPSSLRQSLPKPFVRALHLTQIVTEEQQFYDFWQTPRFSTDASQVAHSGGVEETPADLEHAMLERRRAASGNAEFEAGLERIKLSKAVLPAMRDAAVRRLRSLVEPKLQQHPDGIPVSTLGEQEHELLATIFLVEALEASADLITQPVPDTVLHFDQAAIGGGIQGNSHPPSFSIQFRMPHPIGGLEINGGGISIPYYKDNDKK